MWMGVGGEEKVVSCAFVSGRACGGCLPSCLREAVAIWRAIRRAPATRLDLPKRVSRVWRWYTWVAGAVPSLGVSVLSGRATQPRRPSKAYCSRYSHPVRPPLATRYVLHYCDDLHSTSDRPTYPPKRHSEPITPRPPMLLGRPPPRAPHLRASASLAPQSRPYCRSKGAA